MAQSERLGRPDTQHVVVEQNFGFQSDLDQVGDDLHVVGSVGVWVHTQRHEQVLSWSRQLSTDEYTGSDVRVAHLFTANPGRWRPLVTNLRVLEPHLEPLDSHEPRLFVTTRGSQKTKQVARHVVHRLPAVQLILEDVKNVVLHTFCQFIIPTKAQNFKPKKWKRQMFNMCLNHLTSPGHDLPFIFRTELFLCDQQFRLRVVLIWCWGMRTAA